MTMNNVYVYTTLLLIFAIVILICCHVIGRREQTSLIRSIRCVMLAAPCTMAAYAGALSAPELSAAVLLYAVYYALSDVLLIYMLIYVQKYIHTDTAKFYQKVIICSIAAADSLLLLLSAFSENIFIFRCEPVRDGADILFYAVTERGALYNLHRLVIYGLVLLIVVPLVYKYIKSPGMYRRKYLFTLLSLLIIMAANMIYLLAGLKIDYSVLTYGLMALAIYYFNLIYVPQGLVEGLLFSSIKSMDDSVICFDIEGGCIYANSMAYAFFRTEDPKPLKDYYRKWMNGRTLAEVEDSSWKETQEGNGTQKYYDVQFKRLCDKKGCYVGCFFKMHDETEEVKKFEMERLRATRDRLTGIYNRERFYEIAAEYVRGTEEPYCMICSDIKDFKLVNDIFGINTGDEILVNIADALRRNARPGTVYGRLSADRFAVCMPKKQFDPNTFSTEIRRIGEFSSNSSYRIHIHIGVYDITDKNMDPSVMCDRAFMAIKTIKSSVTDMIAYYGEEIRLSSLSEQRITSEFDAALEGGQFCFYLQPQVSVQGKVLGGEALVRWIHPEQGMIPPNLFIGVLEQTGLIYRLDLHTWEAACRKLREWKDRGLTDYHISVNISPKDFYFMDIYKTFTGLAEKYELNPRNLKLEITETAIMNDFNKQMMLIQRLREYGFQVEMDDFGSGYSSLNMLKDMIVDTLKVDMGFLRHTDQQERSRTILKMIITLSKQLGMEVVTEGVETKEYVDFLTDIGCDIFQGYYFAKPMPVDEFENRYLYSAKA